MAACHKTRHPRRDSRIVVHQGVRGRNVATHHASTGKRIRACTFHSLGLEICRAATIANRPIIDGHASNTVVRNTFEQLLSKNIGYRLLAFKLMSKELLSKYGKAAKSEDFQLPTDDYGFNQYKQNLIENAQTIIQHMRQNNIGIDGMRELNERSGGKNVGRNREMLQLIEPSTTRTSAISARRMALIFPA